MPLIAPSGVLFPVSEFLSPLPSRSSLVSPTSLCLPPCSHLATAGRRPRPRAPDRPPQPATAGRHPQPRAPDLPPQRPALLLTWLRAEPPRFRPERVPDTLQGRAAPDAPVPSRAPPCLRLLQAGLNFGRDPRCFDSRPCRLGLLCWQDGAGRRCNATHVNRTGHHELA